jgi:hypothetical protein
MEFFSEDTGTPRLPPQAVRLLDLRIKYVLVKLGQPECIEKEITVSCFLQPDQRDQAGYGSGQHIGQQPSAMSHCQIKNHRHWQNYL